MEITGTISHCLPASTLRGAAISLQGRGQYLSTLPLMMHSVLHCSEHRRSAHLWNFIHSGHSSLNIAALLLLHQTLLGLSANNAGLNGVEVKMFCLGFLSTSAPSSVGLESPTQNRLPSISSCHPGFLPCFILLHVRRRHSSVLLLSIELFSPPSSLFPLLTYFVVPTITFCPSGLLRVHFRVSCRLICRPSCHDWEISHVGGCPGSRCF